MFVLELIIAQWQYAPTRRTALKSHVKQVNSFDSPTAFKHSQFHSLRLSRAMNEAVSMVSYNTRPSESRMEMPA